MARTPGWVIDPDGRNILRTNYTNITGIRDVWHNDLVACICDSLKGAGVDVRAEVMDVLASHLPATSYASLLNRFGGPVGVRRVVPDILVANPTDSVEFLTELKTLSWRTGEFFGPAALAQRAPGEAPVTRGVDRRASQLTREYRNKAKEIDESLYNDGHCVRPPHGTPGPAESRIASFGAVRGLVFGHLAQASADAHKLLELCAYADARRTWRTSGLPDLDAASRAQVNRYYAEWGLTAARARARALLRLLPHALGQATGSRIHVRSVHADVARRQDQARQQWYDVPGGAVIRSQPAGFFT